MRWWIIVVLAAGILFGVIGRATDLTFFDLLAGFCFLAVIGGVVAALPLWRKAGLPAMSGLFRHPGPGEAWSVREGAPTARTGRPREPGPTGAGKSQRRGPRRRT